MSIELIATDLQGLTPGSALVDLFEIQISDSTWIYLANEYLDPSTSTKIQFRDKETPSTIRTYQVIPIMIEDIETNTQGALPRPSMTIANVFKTLDNTSLRGAIYTANGSTSLPLEKILGLKVRRRRTLKKYLYGQASDQNPPVEYPTEVYVMDRITEETNEFITFELVAPFDLEGVRLPRRTVISNACAWKYQGAGNHLFEYEKLGGCSWNQESTLKFNGTEHTVYVNSDDEYVVPNTITFTTDPGAGTRSKDGFYKTTTTAIKVNADGSKTSGSSVTDYWQAVRDTTDDPSDESPDWARVRVYDVYDSSTTYNVYTDSGRNEYVQYSSTETVKGSNTTVTRLWKTQYRTQTADNHISTPEFNSFWARGDICGKRLTSCSMRFGYNPISSGTPGDGPSQTLNDGIVKPFGGFPTSRAFDL